MPKKDQKISPSFAEYPYSYTLLERKNNANRNLARTQTYYHTQIKRSIEGI